MTLQFNGGARTPGPLGRFPEGVGGRVPGPIGRILWDKQTPSPTPGAVTKAVKTTPMPPPTKDQDGKNVHVVTWPLYSPAKKGPAYGEVKQAPGIANCPVGAILAALAFTSAGSTVIQRMVTEKADNVTTDLSALPPATLSDPPGGTISSARYFTVQLAGGSVDVSDVLYTDDHDSGWSPLYIRDPSDQSIWAAVIEKALAVKLGSYENFDALNISANDFWEKITGVKPGGIEIKADTPLKDIIAAAEKSTRVPSIGASKPNGTDVKIVTEFHGFAMLGVQGSQIRLYDAARAKTLLISPADFRHDFQAILFRN
jgi:hypothetical protein